MSPPHGFPLCMWLQYMNIHEHTWAALECRLNSTCKSFNPECRHQALASPRIHCKKRQITLGSPNWKDLTKVISILIEPWPPWHSRIAIRNINIWAGEPTTELFLTLDKGNNEVGPVEEDSWPCPPCSCPCGGPAGWDGPERWRTCDPGRCSAAPAAPWAQNRHSFSTSDVSRTTWQAWQN